MGTCLIITEFFTTTNIEALLLPYRDIYAENFNFLVLKIAGFNKENFKYFTNFKNNRIEMGFIAIEDIKISDIIIKRNTEIITAISYRYTRRGITNNILKHFHHYEYFEDESRDLSLVAFKLFSK